MAKRISIQDQFKNLRKSRIANGCKAIPESLQGVTKSRVSDVLSRVGRGGRDRVDCVFALLDDETESFKSYKFADAATTARLGSHIAFLQRDNDSKLDREGRDQWIAPLREIGAIEPVTFHKGEFLPGHIKPKSPNSGYRLNREFVKVLKAPDDQWQSELQNWISEDTRRKRLEFQSRAAEESRKKIDTGHKQLIAQSIDVYAKHFLPGFEVLFKDDSDGQRISEDEKEKLKSAGVTLGLEDAFPDVLLWNPKSDELWCIEAVTSDGEVDTHEVEKLKKLATRCKKKSIGFTTTYRTWKEAASRQGNHKNLAIGSFLWIAADPSRQFRVLTAEAFEEA